MSIYPITEYGTDESTMTEAFRAAVRACESDGGGTVRVPPGDYVVGSVELAGDVTLSLAPGATVRASLAAADYDCPRKYVGPDGERPLFFVEGGRNVTIEGEGTIDGRGTEAMEMDEPIRGHSGQSSAHPLVSEGEPRPRQGDAFLDPEMGTETWPVAKPPFRPGPTVLFDDCANVSVRDVTVRDAPAWTLAFRDCESVRVTGVTIRNHLRIPNCDGLSVENSRRVRVSDCAIRTCDDAITVVARGDGPPCRDVVVTNCTLTSRACAIKLGSETAGDIRNCAFRNCVVSDSNRGLGIQHRDGGDVSNVRFSDVTVETRLIDGPWWGKGEPIYVTSVPRDDATTLGSVRNVRFTNVDAHCENGALVYGHADATLEDVQLDGVRLDLQTSPEASAVGGNFDLQPTSVGPPIFERDVPGVHCENVAGLELTGLVVDWDESMPDYHTHGVACVGVDDLSVDGFDGRPAHVGGGDAAIHLQDTSTVSVRNSRARPGTGAFLVTEGTDDERLFAANDLTDAEKMVTGSTAFTVAGNARPRGE